MPEVSDHWYERVVDTTLRQGDIFRDLRVWWLPDELPAAGTEPGDDAQIACEWAVGDWIVATASCDIVQRRNAHCLLCRVSEANSATLRAQTEKELAERREVIRKGQHPRRFLLPEFRSATPALPLSVVVFEQQVLLPVRYLQESATVERLRLMHPFREKFGSWIGERFSEIGPEDHTLIPQFVRTFEKHLLETNDVL